MSQEFNSAQINELRASFIDRNDIVNRWGNLIGSYLALPGLRFFAPMSVVGASGEAVDLALGNSLANTNSATFNYTGLAPFCLYNGTTQYHSIADNAAHDILGNEGYVNASAAGLTIGMWLYAGALAGATARFFAKGTSTGNARAYNLMQTAGNLLQFQVSDNGTNVFNATAASSFSAGAWYFLAGRYDPSTEIELYVGSSTGLATFSNVTAIPATLNNSATGLAIGAAANGIEFSNIRASMCFICAEQVSDAIIFSLFEQGRRIFGI